MEPNPLREGIVRTTKINLANLRGVGKKRHVRGKLIEVTRWIRRNERRKSLQTIQHHLLFML